MHYIQIAISMLLLTQTIALFGDSLKKLRQKASEVYRTQSSEKSLNFLGHIASDYPGTNPKYLKINEDLWENYYSCLRAQQNYIGDNLSLCPEAILGFEGGNVKLECKICVSPLEAELMELVVWQWAAKDGLHLEPVEFHENIILSPKEKTLHIYNLDSTHSGQYMCTLGEAATAPYFLTVISVNDSNFDAVHNQRAPLGPYPKVPEYLNEYNLVLDTEWSDWSTCSTCGIVGKKHKLGYCSVYSKETKSTTSKENEINTNFSVSHNKTIKTVQNADFELFNVFKFGIPCNSHIMPISIGELPPVRTRNNEIITGFCKLKCPTNEIFLVKDKHGNVIEKANNSAGIYSMLQPLPPLEPPVARQVIYGVKGKSIILSCPGSLNTDSPIQWQIGSKKLIPEIISSESKGRIFITITDRIRINQAKISDSNVYSCWQHDELAGTIRLVVEKKIEFNFNHTVMLIGIVVILVVFLKIFVKAIVGRKYAKV
ncbi:uncharacterized protein LOC130893390 [Diorhabda carinulata]|uniref:uncharacterized protein LOC130893390 n=1 Tax=Diorhabda carinulata TaxID=1163345 RepID=UPI0025A133E3|nr:uncharacterized protein LOC130893390 [Diorhabda carinulata]